MKYPDIKSAIDLERKKQELVGKYLKRDKPVFNEYELLAMNLEELEEISKTVKKKGKRNDNSENE